MAKYFILFTVLVSIPNCMSEWNTKDYSKREHSIGKPPYQGSGMSIPFWDFSGNTIITQEYIRLTPDRQSMRGILWNNVPCKMRNWEIQIQFKVHGHGKDLYGDGWAFWYAKHRMQHGEVFGSIDKFLGLAIFADTYSNHNGPHNHGHPYLSAMVNNGSFTYDHDRDGTHTELAGCEASFRQVNHDTHISIRYENDVLTVATDIEGKNAWKDCFKVHGVKLPTGYYFGVSAATGELTDNHDIVAIKAYQLDLDDQSEEDRSNIIPSASFFSPPREHVDDAPAATSGFKLFLIMVFALLGLFALVVVGIMVYQKHQESSRKRFY